MWVRETCIDQQQKAPEGNHSQQSDKLSSAFFGVRVWVVFFHIPPPPPHYQHLPGDFLNLSHPRSVLFLVFIKFLQNFFKKIKYFQT